MAELRLEQVGKRYTEERRAVYALKNISLTIEQGEFVFLIGSSGAGKTTLLKLMSGELSPDEGTVFLNGANLARMIGPLAGSGDPDLRCGQPAGPADP